MGDFFGNILNAVTGGVFTGLFGVAIQRYFDLKKYSLDLQMNQQKNQHEQALKRLDLEILEKEALSRVQVAEIDADARTFAASFNEPQKFSEGVKYSNKQAWALVALDFIRGIVRPSLTVYLCILTTLIYYKAEKLLRADGVDAISTEMAVDLNRYIIGVILYLTTTCVTWWFGTRNKQKQLGPAK